MGSIASTFAQRCRLWSLGPGTIVFCVVQLGKFAVRRYSDPVCSRFSAARFGLDRAVHVADASSLRFRH
jgi:hypothetical protein